MSCPFEIDVVRWVTGDTRLNELARVEEHVAGCAICKGKAESLRAMLSRIADAPPPGQKDESSPKVFVDSVMERIGRESSIPPRRSARRPLAFAVGLALPLVLLGAWTIHRMNQSGQAMSGATAAPARAAAVDIALFVRRDGQSLPVEKVSLRPTDELLIRYDNPGLEPRYFVALTLDAAGNAQWLHPSEKAGQANPGAMALRGESKGQVVDELLPLGLAKGALRVIALTSDDPKKLDGAREILQGRTAQASVVRLFDGAVAREWELAVEDR